MNFKENRRLVQKLRSIDNKLYNISSFSKECEKDVLSSSNAYLENEKKNILDNMPIEVLSKSRLGIRVTALRNAGITTIGRLRKYSAKSLLNIKGVGENSAYNAVSVCKEIVNEVEKNTKISISPEDGGPSADKLLAAVYRANASAFLSDRASKIYNTTHSDIKSLIKCTAPARNRILWFLSPKRLKEKALEAVRKVEATLTGSYKDEFEELYNREQKLLKASHNDYWKDFAENAADYYSRIEHIRAQGKGRRSENLKNKELAIRSGLSEPLIQQIESADLKLQGLKCIPRQYQAFGMKYILNQGNVLLGDEMGLGKTIQAIGVMVALRNSGETHFIVVCPNSVLINWCREIEKHSDLISYKLHGKDIDEKFESWIKQGGVAVTSFESLSKIEFPEGLSLSLLVVDEAHYIKNPNAQRTRNVISLGTKSKRRLFMTGTALENNINEMLFLIQCLQPGIADKLRDLTRHSDAAEFRAVVAPVYFRRVRDDVMSELPSKIEQEEWCSMGNAESEKYCEAVYAKDFMQMRQVSWNIDSLDDSSKAGHLKELCSEAVSLGRKIIVFSFFINTINQVQKLFDRNICYGPITGSISPEHRQEIIDRFSESEGGAILLSQIQAGGTGLNIQAASVVIFCEPQLKPSLENQAISRAYRMGQLNTVMVYRLLCENSVDERIMAMLNHKQALFDAFADKSVSGEDSLSLSKSEAGKLIEQEIERLKSQ